MSSGEHLHQLLESVVGGTDMKKIIKFQSHPDGIRKVTDEIRDRLAPMTSMPRIICDLVCRDVQGCVKDLLAAQTLRTAGNELYVNRKYLLAARRYSDALRFLPSTPSHAGQRSKIHCNRALCLSKLGDFKNAEHDATSAIQADPSNAKAFYRRAVARCHLAKPSEAMGDAQRALELLSSEGASTREVIDFMAQFLTAEQLTRNEEGSTLLLPQATRGDVPVYNAMEFLQYKLKDAKALQIKNDPEKFGRHLVACESIAPGTELFADEPVSHVMSKRRRLTVCEHCCSQLPLDGAVGWPCPDCAMVFYCSPSCQAQLLDSFHEPGGAECGMPWPALLPTDLVLALRLARRLKVGMKTRQHEIDLVASLQTHFAVMKPEDVVRDAALACMAELTWNQAGAPPLVGNIQLGGDEVLKALCIVRINGMAIVPRAFGHRGDETAGLAVYPIASYLNHSCVPNGALVFDGLKLTARSVKRIESGEPVLHCYGPQPGEMTSRQRQEMLQRQYHFECECQACTLPPPSEMEMVGLKCRRRDCRGVLPVPVAVQAGLASKYDMLQCCSGSNECSKECGGGGLSEDEWISEFLPSLRVADDAFRAATIKERMDLNERLELLCSCLERRCAVLHPNNQLIGATHNALAEVYKAVGDLENSIKHCAVALEIVENTFPAESTNVAFARLELADLLQKSAKRGGLASDLQLHAREVLQMHFGDNYV